MLKKLVNWFEEKDKQGEFHLLLMNDHEKSIYAGYLGTIGTYYRKRLSDYNIALQYYTKATKILDSTSKKESWKFNLAYLSALSNIELGKRHEAENNIYKMEEISANGLIDKSDLGLIHRIKATVKYHQGNYEEALMEVNQGISDSIKHGGIKLEDTVLTAAYISKSAILNSLKKYQEAYDQIRQVYNMHKSSKNEGHIVFGQIFTQMSRAQLGFGNAKEALDYAKKARTIFINDPSRLNNSRDIAVSPDIYLAKACVAEADALSALGQNEKAAKSYLDAENFYWNNYRENMGNVDEVSSMYLSAAKATCNLTEKAWYVKFHDQHIKQFGSDHPRSIEILNMDAICYPEAQR